MSGQPTAAALTDRPDPPQDRPAQDRPVAGTDAPSRTVRLIGLVRKLIDYGKDLVTALQQHVPGTALVPGTRYFGTIDIALILSLITRGLHRAAALEARLISRLDREEAARPAAAAAGAVSPRQPRAAQPAARRAEGTDPRLAHLPTPEAIAAEVRRRPVGAVLADICRDLGIVPSHPIWRELSLAIMTNGGDIATLFKDMAKRVSSAVRRERPAVELPEWPASAFAPPVWPASCPPSAVAFGTGPP